MERVSFETGQFYHIYNRGIDGRRVFIKERDYSRFVGALYYFNDINFRPENFQYQGDTLIKSAGRETLVDIVAWCLMPNHYHLILRQKDDGNITRFMRRVGTGFTMFFNKKYQRSGNLFTKPFKVKHLKTDDYLLHATRYVHLNPLELFDSTWKERGAKDMVDSKKFVLRYPWSSLQTYLGQETLKELISPSEFWTIFEGGPNEYRGFLWEWLTTGVPAPFDVIKVSSR